MMPKNIADTPSPKDVLHTMRFPDGRTLIVEIPAEWTTRDRSGELLFHPQAVRLLDRLRTMSVTRTTPPTPGYITTLRQALAFTQSQFAAKLHVTAMTVSRWERGSLRPSIQSAKAMDRLRKNHLRKGTVIAA